MNSVVGICAASSTVADRLKTMNIVPRIEVFFSKEWCKLDSKPDCLTYVLAAEIDETVRQQFKSKIEAQWQTDGPFAGHRTNTLIGDIPANWYTTAQLERDTIASRANYVGLVGPGFGPVIWGFKGPNGEHMPTLKTLLLCIQVLAKHLLEKVSSVADYRWNRIHAFEAIDELLRFRFASVLLRESIFAFYPVESTNTSQLIVDDSVFGQIGYGVARTSIDFVIDPRLGEVNILFESWYLERLIALFPGFAEICRGDGEMKIDVTLNPVADDSAADTNAGKVDAKAAIESVLQQKPEPEAVETVSIAGPTAIAFSDPAVIVKQHLENLYSILLNAARDSTIFNNLGLNETQIALFASAQSAIHSVRTVAELCGVELPVEIFDAAYVPFSGVTPDAVPAHLSTVSGPSPTFYADSSLQQAMRSVILSSHPDCRATVENAFDRLIGVLNEDQAENSNTNQDSAQSDMFNDSDMDQEDTPTE